MISGRRAIGAKGGDIKISPKRIAIRAIFLLTVLWMIFTLYYRESVSSNHESNPLLAPIAQSLLSSSAGSSHFNLRQVVKSIVNNTQSISALNDGSAVGNNMENRNPEEISSHTSHDREREDSHHGYIPFHSVFSTDCSPFQDWQTLLLFHSAVVVKQVGPITRIASGCSDAKKAQLTTLYRKLYPQYHVHFTPDYKTDAKTNKKYDFYNKPYGMLHWLTHADPPVKGGTIIALLDPDFVFLRPLTANVSPDSRTIVSAGTSLAEVFQRVDKGHPVAQQYGLGAPWVNDRNKQMNRTRICGVSSPCTAVPDEHLGSKHYSVGAPYILEKEDMVRLVTSWVEFVPRVYDGYPDLLAEMYAYSMAAAHNELPHLQLDHFMVSNVDMDQGEGWQWVDALGDDVCAPPDEQGLFYPDMPLPTFVHYCQFFRAAEWGFHKRRVYGDIFSCHRPMLLDPHLPYGNLSSADKRIPLVDFKDRDGEIVKMSRKQVRRSSFVLCVLHTALNAALLDYKTRMCHNDTNTNYEKSVNVALITKY